MSNRSRADILLDIDAWTIAPSVNALAKYYTDGEMAEVRQMLAEGVLHPYREHLQGIPGRAGSRDYNGIRVDRRAFFRLIGVWPARGVSSDAMLVQQALSS